MARQNASPAWLKPMAHGLAALPGLWLLASWSELLWIDPASLRLSAEPVTHTHNALGLQALRLLVAALAVTPLFRLTRWTPAMSLRRPLGLWAFAYAGLHLGFYLAMELDFRLAALWREALGKPFIFFGLLAFLCLLPLAATSTRRAIKALGGRRWQMLHKLVYAVALLGLLHFYLKKAAKNDVSEVMVYAVILALLLGWRVVRRGGILAMLRVR